MTQYPSLTKDRAFWGITLTQFLGAFNDNVFKMLLFLICADYVGNLNDADSTRGDYFDPYQTLASLLFAFAFVMFSGFAGFLSDRFSKKKIVIACKVAEIVVMCLGFLIFLTGSIGTNSFLVLLFGVLFLMGTQSAFFGPSKFGILPEMFSDTDLPIVNGVILGTTFLAIIFGTAIAGFLKEALGDQIWGISLLCIVLAFIGTGTAFLLRRTPCAQPDLKFHGANWFGEPAIWKRVVSDKLLLKVLLVYATFWFVGGVVALTITLVGRIQLELSETVTSFLNAGMGLGIGTGSVVAAAISKKDVRFGLVKIGSAGMFVGLGLAALFAVLDFDSGVRVWLFGIALAIGGFFGGWVAVPLQVFIQSHPPSELKGRIIAVMNLMTWIGILAASVYYFSILAVTGFQMDPSWILLTLAFLMLCIAFVPIKSMEHLKEERTQA